jgi:hypothetical protein
MKYLILRRVMTSFEFFTGLLALSDAAIDALPIFMAPDHRDGSCPVRQEREPWPLSSYFHSSGMAESRFSDCQLLSLLSQLVATKQLRQPF